MITLQYHYSLGRITKTLEEQIKKGHTEFVIYPFGEIGKLGSQVLKSKYGKEPLFFIDNLHFDGENVLSLEQAKQRQESFIILICSDREEIYEIIRDRLYDAFPKESVADCFDKKKDELLISENELLIGEYLPLVQDGERSWKNLETELSFFSDEKRKKYNHILIARDIGLIARNPGVHLIPDYQEILEIGIDGKLKMIREYAHINVASTEFYLVLEKEWIVLQNRILEYAQIAEKCGNHMLGQRCKKIAYEPPGTFPEAIQLLIFLHTAVVAEAGSGSISFGRIDQYLYPFYKSDVDNGRIDFEEAYRYIVTLWKKISEHGGLSWQNITIGGKNRYGEDQCNEITIMALRASQENKMDQPQLSFRYHEKIRNDVWNEVVKLIRQGKGFPEIYNDEIAVQAKKVLGLIARMHGIMEL